MRRGRFLLLSLILTFTPTGRQSVASGTPPSVVGVAAATAATAVAGPWWAPLISLVSSFLSSFKGNKVDNNAAQKSVTANSPQMSAALALLQAWPNLLDQSQHFRENAI